MGTSTAVTPRATARGLPGSAATKRPRTIPAVAVTAFSSAADRAKALDAGFAEHVSKPVDMAKLIEIVARLAPVES